MKKDYSFYCILLLIIFNSGLTNVYSFQSNNNGNEEIGKLIIPKNSISKKDVLELQFQAYSKLSDVKLEVKEEDGNYFHSKNFSAISKDENINFDIALKKVKSKKSEYDISPYIKVKNKTISVLDVLISAKSEENADVYFGRKVVIEYISNKEIKLWEYADYLKSNGDNDGVLGVYSGDVLSNDIGSKPNVGKIKKKKQYLYREENNHNVNNIFQQNAEVQPYASITSNDITVTVQGYIYYEDSNGNTKPLPYSEVEVWEDDGNSAYSAFEWSDLTSSTGYFNVTVTHNDNDTNLELFLRVKSLNSWISVENYTNWIPGNGLAVYGDQPFQWTGNTVNNITGGTVSMNYIIDDTRKGAAQLFDWLMTTTIFTRNSFDPGAVQAVWPAGSYAYSDPAYNNNLVIGDLHTNSNYPDVVFHEFGHTTMYRRNSYSAPNSTGQHSLSGLYSPGLAWSEGWATAYSQFILNDGRYDAANFAPLRPHVENAKLGYGDNATYYPPNAQDNSSHNEVWVVSRAIKTSQSGPLKPTTCFDCKCNFSD